MFGTHSSKNVPVYPCQFSSDDEVYLNWVDTQMAHAKPKAHRHEMMTSTKNPFASEGTYRNIPQPYQIPSNTFASPVSVNVPPLPPKQSFQDYQYVRSSGVPEGFPSPVQFVEDPSCTDSSHSVLDSSNSDESSSCGSQELSESSDSESINSQ